MQEWQEPQISETDPEEIKRQQDLYDSTLEGTIKRLGQALSEFVDALWEAIKPSIEAFTKAIELLNDIKAGNIQDERAINAAKAAGLGRIAHLARYGRTYRIRKKNLKRIGKEVEKIMREEKHEFSD